ncbi:B3 domain-containing protein Os04g0386900-like isoform X2 [Tasmannia lanceolata]|uniref:B3 domain-containing protein Os04g0386900-like isoform X2 n=1 Tax=Tasmannia lanceolata TaxID=3420 RepID=UPI004064B859
MTDPSVKNPNVEAERCEVTSEENNGSGAYIDQFLSSNSSISGESKEGTCACSTISMGSITFPEEGEILPLTGKPYFVVILSNAAVKSQLSIPLRFVRLLPSASIRVVLHCRNKKWETLYSGDKSFKRFDPSWRRFVIDNKLKVGDACVFELMDSKNFEFRVQILDGEVPHDLLTDGENEAAPIIIE